MNSPPDSFKFTMPPPDPTSDGERPQSTGSSSLQTSAPSTRFTFTFSDPTASSSQLPSPATTTPRGTTIAVGSAFNEEDLYEQIAAMDLEGYPASMTSSVRNHIHEGGLRYHAYHDGLYAFPNDEVEQNRDDMKHQMTISLCDMRYHYAPVDDVLRSGGEVIDLGTGTGIWAIEFADLYPNARITGVDLSPIQPSFVPANVHFAVDDIEQEWVDGENTYDFIHIRHTLHSIKDLNTLLQRIYRHLKPGGWVEFQEMHYVPHCDDDSATPATPYAFRDFMQCLADGLHALGSDLNAILRIPQTLQDTGFQNMRTAMHKLPVGVWPRDPRLRLCGLFWRTAIMDGLRGLVRRPFGRGLHWTEEQIEVFLVSVRRDLMNSAFHTYFPLHMVWAQKPL